MATSKKFNRRTLVKIEVTAFLLFIFLIGFVLGMVVGRLTKPKEVVIEQVKAEAAVVEKVETYTPAEPVVEEIVTEEVIEEETPTPTYYDIPLSHEIQDYIFERCEEDNVPVPLVIALIDKESNFTARTISGTNDYGLMQINAVNHEWLSETYGVSDFLDPYDNIYCGVKIIAYYLEKYGDVHKSLMAYNFGEGGAMKVWNRGIYTSEYSRSVVEKMEEYESGTRYETP